MYAAHVREACDTSIMPVAIVSKRADNVFPEEIRLELGHFRAGSAGWNPNHSGYLE